jgi:hypothetical protein
VSRARARHPRVTRRGAVRLLAALSLGLVISAAAGSPAGGAEDAPSGAPSNEEFIPGSGKAEARIINVGPKAAKLSLAPTLGVTLADYLNTLGRGESLVFDWVALEDSVPVEVRTELPPLRAESTGKPQCRDRVRTTPGGSPVGVFEQRSKATPTGPFGESTFRLASFAVPGAFEIAGAEAHSTAGIVEKEVREATGVTEIAKLSIGEGAVTLKGLRWEAVHRSGDEKKMDGGFTIEAASLAGVPLPIPSSGELRDVIGPINDALAPLGIGLRLPVADTSGGVARITPLAIQIFESPMRSTLLGPLFGNIQPLRQPLVDELFGLAESIDEQTGLGAEDEVTEGDRELTQVECNGDMPPNAGNSSGARDYSANGILVTDITLGAISGVSSLTVALGGAVAFTEGQRFENPFGIGSFKAPPVPVSNLIPGTPGSPGTPGTPGSQAAPSLNTGTAAAGRTVPGQRGGIAMWIGLAGLLLAGVIGATDWYLIRKARAILPAGPSGA